MRMILMQKIWLNWINKFLIIACCFLINGCASSGTAIPQGGPTMADVYADAMKESNGETLNQARAEVPKITITDTRTPENEINNLFPQLPNPQIVMYVHPHLSSNNEAPVPGYSTAFNLYDTIHYALPGEYKHS